MCSVRHGLFVQKPYIRCMSKFDDIKDHRDETNEAVEDTQKTLHMFVAFMVEHNW